MVWLGQVENAIPSVVLAARDPRGRDLAEIRVTLDGRPLVDHLDARAVALDPGPHVFTFVTRRGAVVEQRALLREGEKAREIRVELPSEEPEPPTPSAPQQASGSTLWPAYALAGTGIAALGLFSYFALSGRSDYVDCRSSCTSGQRDTVAQKFVGADVALGVSVLALGTGLYWFLTNRTPDPSTSRTAVTIEPNARAPGMKLTLAF